MPDSSVELLPGEQVVVRARAHPIVFAGTVGFAASVLGAAWLIVARNELDGTTVLQLWLAALASVAVGLVSPVLRWRNAECVVTNRRLLLRRGVLHPQTSILPLSATQDVTVEQGFAGRLLGYGTLHVVAADGGIEGFARVRHPEVVRDAIRKHAPGTSGRRR